VIELRKGDVTEEVGVTWFPCCGSGAGLLGAAKGGGWLLYAIDISIVLA
jgi:hypothetical protein